MNTPHWLKYGIYYFAVSFVLFVFGIYVTKLPGIIQFVLGVGMIAFFSRLLIQDVRADSENQYMTYGEAFLPIFLMLSVGLILSSIFTAVWVNFIDVDAKDIMIQQSTDAARSVASFMGAPEGAIDDQEDAIAGNFEFSKMLFGVIWLPFVGAFVAAITALFFRKEEVIGYK